MKELIIKNFPKPPAIICDIGGGAGEYSFWLASIGYQVHLMDIVPLHIAQAKERANIPGEAVLSAIKLGDALSMDYEDNYFDAVFMGGPLYHLVNKEDRAKALQEARRVLKPKGVLVAYGITRYASLIAGLLDGRIYNHNYLRMLKTEIPTGLHYSPDSRVLKTAYFHLPEELKTEVEESGLLVEKVLGVLGPAWMAKDFDANWNDIEKRETILEIARLTENQPELGPRTMVVARK